MYPNSISDLSFKINSSFQGERPIFNLENSDNLPRKISGRRKIR
ncbi:hypothetical protein D1AOALGA4SA_4735 [Olavius algarvensis Delta 1 endosymbiont]|nr:hypothetical protein D1AOALGA4SA_4735 [Olavius algarvensis Delta 1 endosymbiont]